MIYRKKKQPHFTAIHVTHENLHQIADQFDADVRDGEDEYGYWHEDYFTIDGGNPVSPGNWIVTDEQGNNEVVCDLHFEERYVGSEEPNDYTRMEAVKAMLLTHENMRDVMNWCQGRTWSRPPMRAITGIEYAGNGKTETCEFGDWVILDAFGYFSTISYKNFQSNFKEP